MKISIFKIAFLFCVLGLVFSSCGKDDSSSDDKDPVTVSSYILSIGDIIATEVEGNISVCPDGFFIINGKAPDGTPIALNSSKILVGETRSLCTINQDYEDFELCVDNGGFNFGGHISGHFYSPISGTATRTSTNDLTVSGILIKDDLSQHSFTLEATASFVSPINCE